jgi:hypothetical protein
MGARYIQTTDRSIKDQVANIHAEQAICEYIWNAFDANASVVEIFVEPNGLDGITGLKVKDNGDSIEYEELDNTFDLFLDSKKKTKSKATTRGKRGRGRFTFIKFADRAFWTTWKDGVEFTLQIEVGYLNKYELKDKGPTNKEGRGTEVYFSPISTMSITHFNEVVVPYIKNEFTWLLLSKDDLKIVIDGNPLILADYQKNVYSETAEEKDFHLQSILWAERPSTEKSYVYFQNSENEIIHKELSELNHKNFFCSAYVQSSWFDDFSLTGALFSGGKNIDSETFKNVLALARNKLRQEYHSYRNQAADSLIQQYLREGIFPEMKGDNRVLNEFYRSQLIQTIKTIFEAEPAVFSQSLNKSQKRILIKLLDRIVQSNRLSELFDVLEGVVSLSEDDMEKIANMLQRTTLENIAMTVEYISARLDIIKYFKALIYDQTKFALEVKHIQRCIESNLWIFGEQYHLLASAEDKFETALRNLLELKGNADHFDVNGLTHPDKNREMDIFAAQKGFRVAEDGSMYFHHVVIELKRPSIKLGDKELDQIKKYKNIIAAIQTVS